MTSDLAALIARTRQRDPVAALMLADLVESVVAIPQRRVGAAFQLKRRGGEPGWRASRRTQRDDAFRALARLLYAHLPIEQQARALVRKAERYIADGWPHERRSEPGANAERTLLRRIGESGLDIPGPRQMRKILAGRD